MSSAVTVVVIAAGAVFAGAGIGWSGRQLAWPRFARRAAARRFAREFAALVQGTDLDLAALRGPSSQRSDPASVAALVEPTYDVSMLDPRPLSVEDQDYYAASWRNVLGEFAECPPSALLLASHLTANLLLNRGLLPIDTARPTLLPEAWKFPSARGYREAMLIDEDASEAESARALGLIEDFYWEMLTLSAVTE